MERVFEDIRDMVMKELEGIASRGELEDSTLCALDKLVDIWKDMDEIEGHEGGYSQDSRYSYGRRTRYNYDRGGNYSRGSRYGGYSREGSTIEKLNHMMEDASSETERDVIRRIMDNL